LETERRKISVSFRIDREIKARMLTEVSGGAPRMSATEEEFLGHLSAAQDALRGYLFTRIRDVSRLEDVLQEVRIALWRKRGSLQRGRPFLGWALGVARNELLHARRAAARSRLIFDAELLEKARARYEAMEPELRRRRAALRSCIGRLPELSRHVVRERYVEGTPIGELGRRLGKTVGAIHKLLSRLRSALAECAERRLKEELAEERP
jgi:RNA polymerase sigma-70 factor (ECF subfamily)